MMLPNRTILLNPGPVTLTERVRRALLRKDLCHREPEFAELTLDIKQRLLRVYPEAQTDYEAILLAGSGTCAVEAMLSSLVPQNGKAIVVTNGVYGERMAKMLQLHGKGVDVVSSSWHEQIDVAEVEKRLAQDSTITHAIAVHHETTTGRLNDISKLGGICKQRNVPLLLDSVSSFGAEPIEFSAWNLEACAATANKCIHGVPGQSFVVAKKSVFESRSSAASTLYLDLYSYHQEQLHGYSPFTQSAQISYGLQEALMEMEELGGWSARNKTYSHRSQRIRDTLASLKVKTLLKPQDYSCVLTSFKLPCPGTYERVYQALKQQGFIIYAGQGLLKNKIFRIANMGDIQMSDIERFIRCLLDVFSELGVE